MTKWHGLNVTFDERFTPTVYGRRGKPLKVNRCGKGGYLGVNTSYQGSTITLYMHVLVATEFVPNPEDLPFVNHIDGDRYNNHPSNLEWVTDAQNRTHAYETGLRPMRPIVPVVSNKEGQGHWFPSVTEAARNGYDYRHVLACAKGDRKTHKGYKWEECI